MEQQEAVEEIPRFTLSFVYCPLCGHKGKEVPGNKIVRFHMVEQKPGYFVEHKWSVNSGRMFSKKVSDEDEIW